MLFKLAISNIRKSYKDYLIYFLTIAISISLFYMFNSMESQKAMLIFHQISADSIDVLLGAMSYVSYFLTFVIAFLMVYANQFLIKRRKKELGIYMTLGMNRLKISIILFLETLLTGLVSLVVGIGIGFIGSHFLSIITAKMFLVDLKEFRFIFSGEAAIKSVFAFGILYIIVMVLNTFNMIKVKLIDLIQDKKSQKQKIKNQILSVIIFGLAILSLAYAYYCITINGMLMINDVFGRAILFGIIGSFLFFMSLASILYALIKKSKRTYYYQLNIFSLRQIYSKVNTTYILMAIISIMLLIAIGTFATGNGAAMAINESLTQDEPFDYTTKIYSPLDFDYQDLPGEHYVYYTHEAPVTYSQVLGITRFMDNLYSLEDMKMDAMKLSDYNMLRKFNGLDTYELAESEVLITYYFQRAETAYSNIHSTIIDMEGASYKIIAINKEHLITDYGANEIGLLVMNDELVDQMPKQHLTINTLSKEKNMINLVKEAMTSYDVSKFRTISKQNIIEQNLSISVLVTYVSIYVGIVFLMASVVILSLQQLSEASDNIKRYELLRKLGVEESQIKHSIMVQIGSYFLLPMMLAIVHSIVCINVSSRVVKIFGNLDVLRNILITSAFVIGIYGSYFVITYISIKSMVLNSK